jgi:L-Ala-D/L-Glu epimerase
MPAIVKLTAEVIEVPLRQTFATAQDKLVRQVSTPVVISLVSDDGQVATGEAVPVAYVTGETQATVLEAVRLASSTLVGQDLHRLRPLVDAVRNTLPSSPTARAGIEMALYSGWAESRGVSLWEMWGGARKIVETDITLPIVDDVVERAQEAASRGFTLFKMKVGSEDHETDFRRLLAIQNAVPTATIRLDANQCFSAEGALRFIDRALEASVRLQLVEQPVPKEDVVALDQVAASSPVPIIADEAVKSPEDAVRLVRETCVHGFNVKLMKAGIAGALDIVAITRAAGRKLMIGCMLETRRGIGVALALAGGTGAFDYVDLDSHLLLNEEGENPFFREDGPLLSVIG